MLRVQGRGAKLCDGITRRDLLQAGAISSLGGLSLARVLQAKQSGLPAPNGPAKAVILINLLGGPSHLDMFDMKPNAPVEIRGEFQPIETSVPGLQICEHLPLTAQTMHQSTLIRTHSHLYNTHSPYNLLSGYSGPVIVDNVAKPTDHPSIGAVMQYAGMQTRGVPSYVWMPAFPGHSQSKRRAGPYGGFLGAQYNPLFTRYEATFDPNQKFGSAYIDPAVPFAEPQLSALDPLPEITVSRLNKRQSLLNQLDNEVRRLDNSAAVQSLDDCQQKAFELLTADRTRKAFDLTTEPESLKQRYGKNLFGSCALTARRLVQAGVKFVGITTESAYQGAVGAGQWDTHGNNFKLLKNFNLPTLDQNYTALIGDLEEKGLLDSTLVVVMGEMGRTPKVKSNGGRDHWTQCGFILMTGGGVKSGYVHGVSDKQAAWPIDAPVSSGDFVATVYQLLGIDPHLPVTDSMGQTVPVSLHGEPVWDVIASAP